MDRELYDNIYQVEKSHWWYSARRKIIFDWVFRILKPKSHPKILDVGCGTGFNMDFIAKNGHAEVVGLDISSDALNYCRIRGLSEVTCGDLVNLPFKNHSFDLVTALDIIEHLDDDQQGLRELARVLTPGGSLVIFVPAMQFLWSLQDKVSHHRRRYTAKDLKNKIFQSGLEIQKLSYANSLLFPLVWGGRVILRMVRSRVNIVSEAMLNPSWSNGILETIFSCEVPMLRKINFPVGVSILCVCYKPKGDVKQNS